MPAPSAVKRSARCASSANSVRRCASLIAAWCAASACHVALEVSGASAVSRIMLYQRLGLAADRSKQILPGGDEGLGAFRLQPLRQRVDIDARLRMRGK